MSNASQQIVTKAWNFAHVLRDDGLSYMGYTEQITFLLFLKMAEESPKGAGQYFTPRELIKGIVDVMQPTADDTLADPGVGTGGFLLLSHDYVLKHQGKDLDPDQKKHLR